LPARIRPKLVITYHQPQTLNDVIRKDIETDCVVVGTGAAGFLSWIGPIRKIRLVCTIDTTIRRSTDPLKERRFKCITVITITDYKTVRKVAEKLNDDNTRIHCHLPSSNRDWRVVKLPFIKM
jgi:hypothetical protein